MNFSILMFLAVAVAVTQAKFLVLPNSLFAAMEKNEIDDGPLPETQVAMLSETLYIPMTRLMTCSNNRCQAACRALGFNHGHCVNDRTCSCYN